VKFVYLTVLLCSALSLGCRAKHKSQGDEAPPPPASAGTVGSGEASPAESAEQALVELKQPELLSGYDFNGQFSCFPLAVGRRCISRVTSLASACRQVNGEVLVCEDCRQLCSRLLKP
jgi:hypothetical protein